MKMDKNEWGSVQAYMLEKQKRARSPHVLGFGAFFKFGAHLVWLGVGPSKHTKNVVQKCSHQIVSS